MFHLDRASAMAHFHEFSDIGSEDEVPIDNGNRRASKMNLKKPPMKVDISSIDSIDTIDRITPNELQDPSCGSFNQIVDTNAAHSRKMSGSSHPPSKMVYGCVVESSGKLANVDANDESPQLNIPDT